MFLLTDGNSKTAKSRGFGWKTWTLELLPHSAGIDFNVCEFSTPGCRKHCVVWSGHGKVPAVIEARRRRKILFARNPAAFHSMLLFDFVDARKFAERKQVRAAIRPNAFSDVPWEERLRLDHWPDIQFYDYTKDWDRAMRFVDGELPDNYHLVYSWSDREQDECPIRTAKEHGVSIALPGDKDKWRAACKKARVPFVDGDEHDMTFLHEPGSLIVLKPKGSLIKANSPFKIQP